jgi:hypothetical protein
MPKILNVVPGDAVDDQGRAGDRAALAAPPVQLLGHGVHDVIDPGHRAPQ